MRIASLIVLFFLVQPGFAESIEYSIYSLPMFFGHRELLETGTLTYSINDVAVAPGPISNLDNRVRTIWVARGFSVSSTSHPEKRVNGFGLWLSKDGKGFSWEWFRRWDGDVFDKLQGPGKVKATFIKRNGLLELASVEVLESLTLRVNTLSWLLFWDDDTYHMVVKEGSVFLFSKAQ